MNWGVENVRDVIIHVPYFMFFCRETKISFYTDTRRADNFWDIRRWNVAKEIVLFNHRHAQTYADNLAFDSR